MKLLLEKGADVNSWEFRSGKTVLMTAAGMGKPEIVKLLLAKGADVNARDRSGKTALIMAHRGRHKETVRLLLEKGSRSKSRNRTALHHGLDRRLPEKARQRL